MQPVERAHQGSGWISAIGPTFHSGSCSMRMQSYHPLDTPRLYAERWHNTAKRTLIRMLPGNAKVGELSGERCAALLLDQSASCTVHYGAGTVHAICRGAFRHKEVELTFYTDRLSMKERQLTALIQSTIIHNVLSFAQAVGQDDEWYRWNKCYSS